MRVGFWVLAFIFFPLALHAAYSGREIPSPLIYGEPIPLSGTPEGRIIKRLAYEEYYCPKYEESLWVAYAYRPTGYTTKRSNAFAEDPEFEDEPALFPSMLFYKGVYRRDSQKHLIGFDKGHQAPDSSIKVYGREAQDETYYLSNMTPQYSNTNQGLWREWEDHIRRWAKPQEPVWVITGPIFYKNKPIKMSKRGSKVAVPHAYFGILTRGDKDKPEVLGYIVENSTERRSWKNEAFQDLTPVAYIESITGFDFLHDLPDPTDKELETKKPEMWE